MLSVTFKPLLVSVIRLNVIMLSVVAPVSEFTSLSEEGILTNDRSI